MTTTVTIEGSGYEGPAQILLAQVTTIVVAGSGYGGEAHILVEQPAVTVSVLGMVDEGPAHISIRQVVTVKIGGVSDAGYSRLSVRSAGDEWAFQGFPAPRVAGYGYTRPSGIVRTTYVSGATRQRRRWSSGYRQGTVSFVIRNELQYAVEEFLSEKGYDWFSMGLITGDNDTDAVELHTVRVIADPAVGEVYGDSMSLSLKIEMQ